MRVQKVRILGIAKDNMLLMAQKVAPLNTKFETSNGSNPGELKTKIKRIEAIAREQNMKEVIGALAKWAIQLRKN